MTNDNRPSQVEQTAELACIGSIGKGERVRKDSAEAVLFEHNGTGCRNHFWFVGNFQGVEDTRIRYYVDGEEYPSIDMSLYMGHGIGFDDQNAPWATKHLGKIGKRNGIYKNCRIPFSKSIRVTAQKSENAEEDPQIWWIIRGTENAAASLGEGQVSSSAGLRLITLNDYDAKPLEEFDLCCVDGKGALYQVAIAAKGESLTYLEAYMRAYMHKDEKPLMLSSGLEDDFLGTFYFDSVRFYSDIAGLTHFDKEAASFSAYRFYDEDPIFFQSGLRLTCRCAETEHGRPTETSGYLNPTKTKYSTCTWIYQWQTAQLNRQH